MQQQICFRMLGSKSSAPPTFELPKMFFVVGLRRVTDLSHCKNVTRLVTRCRVACYMFCATSNGRAHLDNVYWGVGDRSSPEVLQQVSGLQAPKLHVRILVVPHDARLPQLYKGPAHVLQVSTQSACLPSFTDDLRT